MILEFAGFWRRFLAYLLDALLIGVVAWIVSLPFIVGGAITAGLTSPYNSHAAAGAAGAMIIIGSLIKGILTFFGSWLYFALMESSSKQATLGKMALSIIVTNENGNRISFGQASGRYFGKIISGLILYIGFFMAGWTVKKQGLHDIMAGTLVIKKPLAKNSFDDAII